MSKFLAKVEDNALVFGLDLDEDKVPSIYGELFLIEGLEELIARGGKIEGAKIVEFGFENGKMVLAIDTDQDGQKVFKLGVNFMEAGDEAVKLVTKKAVDEVAK